MLKLLYMYLLYMGYVYGLNKIYYYNELNLFIFFNVATRKFKITYVPCIIFLLDSAILEHFSKSNPNLVCCNNSLLLSWRDTGPEGKPRHREWLVQVTTAHRGKAGTQAWVPRIQVQNPFSLLFNSYPAFGGQLTHTRCFRAGRARNGSRPTNYFPNSKWGPERSNDSSTVTEWQSFLSISSAVALYPFILIEYLLWYIILIMITINITVMDADHVPGTGAITFCRLFHLFFIITLWRRY